MVVDLQGQIYSCKQCKTHLGKEQDIMSKYFQCKSGQAYFFNNVVNVSTRLKEEKMMITGLYTTSDIFCVGCGSNVGWKYETAHDHMQKYKEGNFVLELFKILGPPHDSRNLVSDFVEEKLCPYLSRVSL